MPLIDFGEMNFGLIFYTAFNNNPFLPNSSKILIFYMHVSKNTPKLPYRFFISTVFNSIKSLKGIRSFSDFACLDLYFIYLYIHFSTLPKALNYTNPPKLH